MKNTFCGAFSCFCGKNFFGAARKRTAMNQQKLVTVTFSDGGSAAYPEGTLISAVGGDEGSDGSLPIAAVVNGMPVDLSTPVADDVKLEYIYPDSPRGEDIIRHSTSHIMAQAVQELYPGAKVTIGPSIEKGFYYDFDYERPFTPEDLEKIEKRMREIIAENRPITRSVLSRDDALTLYKEKGEPYKVEIISEIEDDHISVYSQGSFTDLCRGPHLPSTGLVRAFKLTSVAGAYWRGNEKNRMLQRIYGTSFATEEKLDNYLRFLDEAKKRDHRKLGKELELFSIHDEVGAGLIIYHPKGALLRRIIEDFEVREHLKRGYQLVKGPQILKVDMWKKSGHLDNYREHMYFTEVDGQQYGLKPMNCLSHMLIYGSKIRSYRDLPLRFFELGTVHRHERAGVLHGLPRVREFTQDDAHILCTPEQLDGEIKGIIDFVAEVMKIFDFEFEMELSTRPPKSIGSDQDWDRATDALKRVLQHNGLPFLIHEGEGAFYGPKIDVTLKDVLDRKWQCATIQCDFSLPERFDLSYMGPDGGRHRPVMLHRVILGSIERFMGVLIEHYAGAFPTWLAPVQAIVLTITEKHNAFAEEAFKKLIDSSVRVEKDFRNESLRLKIREAQLQKIPYMLVIGDKEAASGGVSPRTRSGKDLGLMPLNDFISLIAQEARFPS
jgi:threonyl-tRNA synthetase